MSLLIWMNIVMRNTVQNKNVKGMDCTNCNADFYYSGQTKTEGSYWIDEDEPSPF
jgi:hypothetical protein